MLAERVVNAGQDYKICRKQAEANKQAVTSIEEDIKCRRRKWKENREQASYKVSKEFSNYLQMKGQSGKIRFKHDESKLEIEVQVDNTKVGTSQMLIHIVEEL